MCYGNSRAQKGTFMDFLYQIITSVSIILIGYIYVNYWSKKKARTGVSLFFEILKSAGFVLGFGTSQLLLYPTISANLVGLGITGVQSTIVTAAMSTLLGLIFDLGVNMIWPYVFHSAQKKRPDKGELKLRYILAFVAVILTVGTMGFSLMSPMFLPDINTKETKDVATEVQQYQSTVSEDVARINSDIIAKENRLDDIDKKIEAMYPKFYQRAQDKVINTVNYPVWLRNKRNEYGYSKLEKEIQSLEDARASLNVDAANRASTIASNTIRSNERIEATNQAKDRLVKEITRYIGAGGTLMEIISIYVLVLLGNYEDHKLGLGKTKVRPGTPRVHRRKEDEIEPDGPEFDIRWNEQEEQAEYLHTYKQGPRKDEKEYKDKNWVRNQLYQNRSRAKDPAVTNPATYIENVKLFEAIISAMQRVEKDHTT